jgi:hypothetical protein
MEMKPGMSYRQLKQAESEVGSSEHTDLIAQVGASNQHQRDPRLEATNGAVYKLSSFPLKPDEVPQKLESFRKRIADIRSALKGE